MPTDIVDIENRLWDAADELRANSHLSSADYSVPVLGLIFLRYAEHRFNVVAAELGEANTRRRKIGPDDYKARGALYLPEEARFSKLQQLPEGENLGQQLNDAMSAIEEANEDLRGVLPKGYSLFDPRNLVELMKLMASISEDISGDAFGKIYEYFLGNFAMAEGSKGGEFYTPESIVRLIVEVLSPYRGKILDPACGSGGMFVHSARFVEAHQGKATDISIYGQERVSATVRLTRMNLAVHGLSGDVREGNTYYEDLHHSVGAFDFVMANPPFNVDRIDKERIADDPRFPFGLPTVDNGNYFWIQLFYSALNEKGRAGFVMANSAAEASRTERRIRSELIRDGSVDTVIAVAPNFFYTVPIPVTLWFLDRQKHATARANEVLFIDARHIYHDIDRAHRDFTPAQLEFLANIVRLHRGEPAELGEESRALLADHFPGGVYADVPGLCAAVGISDIQANNWSLNPGRYVGAPEQVWDSNVLPRLRELRTKFEQLEAEALELGARVRQDVSSVLSKTLDAE